MNMHNGNLNVEVESTFKVPMKLLKTKSSTKHSQNKRSNESDDMPFNRSHKTQHVGPITVTSDVQAIFSNKSNKDKTRRTSEPKTTQRTKNAESPAQETFVINDGEKNCTILVNNTVDIKGKNVKLGQVHVTNEPEVKINGKSQEKVKVSGLKK